MTRTADSSSCLRAAAALLSAAAVACVPIPLVPGDFETSRTNIDAASVQRIVAGRSTRADVLLELGEPDGQSDSADRFVYSRVASKGGIAFLVAGAAGNSMGAGTVESRRMSYLRLVIRFDASGVVTDAKLQSDACLETDLGDQALTGRCADVTGLDLPPLVAAAESAALAEIPGGRSFAPARWIPGLRGYSNLMASGGTATAHVRKGRLVVGASRLLFVSPEGDEPARVYLELAFKGIAEAYVDELGSSRSLVVRRPDGRSETFSFGGFWTDRKATEAALEAIEAKRKSTR